MGQVTLTQRRSHPVHFVLLLTMACRCAYQIGTLEHAPACAGAEWAKSGMPSSSAIQCRSSVAPRPCDGHVDLARFHVRQLELMEQLIPKHYPAPGPAMPMPLSCCSS